MSDNSEPEFTLNFDNILEGIQNADGSGTGAAALQQALEEMEAEVADAAPVQPVQRLGDFAHEGMSAADDLFTTPEYMERINIIGGINKEIEELEEIAKQAHAIFKAEDDNKKEQLAEFQRQMALIQERVTAALQAENAVQANLKAKRNQMQAEQDKLDEMRKARLAELALQQAEDHWNKVQEAWQFLWVDKIKAHQLQALRYIVDAFQNDLHGFLVADQPGVGKTLEATAAIDVIQGMEEFELKVLPRLKSIKPANLERNAVLWLAPSATKPGLVKELQKWGRMAHNLEGDADERRRITNLCHEFGLILVVSYEQIRDRKGESVTASILEKEWPIIVLDEAHKFKNSNSSTFDRVKQLVDAAGFIIPMTGTPIMNKPQEFWAILHMLTRSGKYRGRFHDVDRFMSNYCERDYQTKRWRFYPYAQDRLIRDVADMLIRRRKKDVYKDMPDETFIEYITTMGKAQREIYDMMRNQFAIYLDSKREDFVAASNFITQIGYFRQIALDPSAVRMKLPDGSFRHVEFDGVGCKLEQAMEIIEELLENDEKVLVFSTYNDPLRKLKSLLDAKSNKGDLMYEGQTARAQLFTGDESTSHKKRMEELFTTEGADGAGCAVLLANELAGGTGLNLQYACSHVVFLDLYWNDATNEQARDRLIRPGQKNAVTVHIIKAEDCVDNYMDYLIKLKLDMIEGVMSRAELRKALDDGLI